MAALRVLSRFLGSSRLAVLLMVGLMCALVSGTLWESARGTDAAQADVYQAPWFVGLLALLALNVLTAVLRRWPFRRHQIGFVITHVAILTTLSGALITYAFGQRGWMSLAPGHSSSRMLTSKQVIVVRSGRRAQEIIVNVDPYHPGSGLPRRFALAAGGELLLQRYMPNSLWLAGYQPADPAAHAAVELMVRHEGGATTRWLSTESPRAQVTDVGNLTVRLRRVHDAIELAAALADQSPASPATAPSAATGVRGGDESPITEMDKGRLEVTVNGQSQTISVAENIGRSVALSDEGLTIKIVRYVPHAVVGPDGHIENRSDRPVNPLVICQVIGPEGSDRRMAFAGFPDFAEMHQRHLRYPQVRVRLEAPVDQLRPNRLELILAPDERLYFVLHGQGQHKTSGQVLVNQPLAAEPGLDLRVTRILPHAQPVTEPTELPYDPQRDADDASPSVRLGIHIGQHSQVIWLGFGRSRLVKLGQQAFQLSFGQQVKRLPFELTLEQFEIDRYPGTQRPAMFRSRVKLTDPLRHLVLHKAIEMNDPLVYRRFNVYQSSYSGEGPQTTSVLSISRDPGWPVVLVGYILLMSGMTVTLVTRWRRHPHHGMREGRK